MLRLNVDNIALWVSIIFIILSPLENIFRTEQIVYIIGIGILGLAVLWRYKIFINNSMYLLAFMGYIFISTYWSIAEDAFNSLIVIYAELLFLFLQLQFNYNKEGCFKIKIAFIIQNLILLIICYMYGSYMDSRFWIKSATSGADPNYLAGWFIIPLCFEVELLMVNGVKKIYKILFLIEIIVSFYYIMQTASKSGFIANVFVIIIAILYNFKSLIREHPRRAIGITVLFSIGILVIFNYMPAYLLQRLANGDMTGTGRFPMWLVIGSEMLNDPLKVILGFGTGAVKYYTGTGLVSHNTFLDLLFNEGIIGISFFICYIKKSLIKTKSPYIIIAFWGMFVLLFTLSAFNTRFFMLILFLIGLNITTENHE